MKTAEIMGPKSAAAARRCALQRFRALLVQQRVLERAPQGLRAGTGVATTKSSGTPSLDKNRRRFSSCDPLAIREPVALFFAPIENGAGDFSEEGETACTRMSWRRFSQPWGLELGAQVMANSYGTRSGSYGWDGGFGTSWFNDPGRDLSAILLTQRVFDSPDPPAVHKAFWQAVNNAM
jgi:hypothetical protein